MKELINIPDNTDKNTIIRLDDNHIMKFFDIGKGRLMIHILRFDVKSGYISIKGSFEIEPAHNYSS